jgi:hypothetical protein
MMVAAAIINIEKIAKKKKEKKKKGYILFSLSINTSRPDKLYNFKDDINGMLQDKFIEMIQLLLLSIYQVYLLYKHRLRTMLDEMKLLFLLPIMVGLEVFRLYFYL